MRTTIDIDATVLGAAKDLARHSRRSVGAVISEWARRGIEASRATPAAVKRNGFPLFAVPPDATPVTVETVNGILADEDLPA